MRLRRRTTEPTGSPLPAFAFCESATAGPWTPHHIREVHNEGLWPGGGIPNQRLALCNLNLLSGWDLPSPVVLDTVVEWSNPRPSDGRVFLCTTCATTYQQVTAATHDSAVA